MSKNDNEMRLVKWSKSLTKKELQALVVQLVDFGIIAEEINFHSDSLAPYWECTGDPLVPGQKCWEDE